MDLEKLKGQFLVEDDVKTERLGHLLEKLIPYCSVSKAGAVEIKISNLSSGQQVRMVLAARAVGSRLDKAIVAEVSIKQLEDYTGLPAKQVAARVSECLREKFAERAARGTYRARLHKIEGFIAGLSQPSNTWRQQ